VSDFVDLELWVP